MLSPIVFQTPNLNARKSFSILPAGKYIITWQQVLKNQIKTKKTFWLLSLQKYAKFGKQLIKNTNQNSSLFNVPS